MRTIKYLKMTLHFCLSLLLISCRAENKVENGNWELEKLKKEIVGEWVFQNGKARSSSEMTSIEFLEDEKFVVELSGDTKENKAVSDEYIVRSADVISLNGVGEIRNINLEQGRLEFSLATAESVTSVSADKSPEMEKDEKTALLCKRWRLLAVENAVDSLKSVDRSYMSFTKSGSYITENYYRPDSPQPSTLKMKWKWHPTIENRIQYWDSRRDGPKVEREYIDIRELTEKSLKITYSNSMWSGNFSFIPEP